MKSNAEWRANSAARTNQESTLSALSCFHCGLSVLANTKWQVQIDGVARSMCCPGCQAVAQTIIDSGFADYYRNRTEFSAVANQETLVPPELQLYDREEVAQQFDLDAEYCEATLSVEGIRCAACVWLIERRLGLVPGIQKAEMNVATERIYVRWSKAVCKPSDILKTLREIGYLAYPFDPVRQGAQMARAKKKLFRQLFIAGLSMMQVMMYALPVYLATDGTMDQDMTNLMRWASLLLTLPAIGYSAQPFLHGAWSNLKNRVLGMDVPVSIGIVAAFVGSLIATLRGEGDVYFDSITMFIFLLLCSRYLELLARKKAASAIDKLQRSLPASALHIPAYPNNRDSELISVSQLREGDVILVRQGEAVAADGIILEGKTAVDLSLLTGESVAQLKAMGDSLPSGAVNTSQPVLVRVTRLASDSTLSVLVKLIEKAGQSKPRLSLWADKVAAWFVAVLLLFAAVIFVIWQWHDPARAWPIAIAVLVVSCPCALSLATPTSLAVATDRLVRQGILIVQPHVLETLNRATHIIFDKTGTLTEGKPSLQNIQTFNAASPDWCLHVAATLEQSSRHPLGMALMNAAKKQGFSSFPDVTMSDVRHDIGQGLEGIIDGTCYRLGSASFVAGLANSPQPENVFQEMTPIYLGTSGAWLARFDVIDALRPEAFQVIQKLAARGKIITLLSGDHQKVTQRVATELGIATAVGECLPEQKLAFVQNLQRDGAIIAMVGDGINDAAVLGAADVSFAMGGGAMMAQLQADCVLFSDNLSSLCEVTEIAEKTLAIIRQNLFWAMLYNVVAIPAAALGLLNPWLSGIGMAMSSAIVVTNALRLTRRTLQASIETTKQPVVVQKELLH